MLWGPQEFRMQGEEEENSGTDFGEENQDHRVEQWLRSLKAHENTSCWAPPTEYGSGGPENLHIRFPGVADAARTSVRGNSGLGSVEEV